MSPKTVSNTQIYGAGFLLRQLSALLQEIEGVRKSEDIECVHRMRVASRRLRSGFPVFAKAIGRKRAETWRIQIRGITRALGEARDTDVQIESLSEFMEGVNLQDRAGIRRLQLRLQQKRIRLQKNVLKALDKFEASGVVQDMAVKLAPLDIFKDSLNLQDHGLLTLSADSITHEVDNLFSFEEAVQNPENIAELHAMRIAAKQFRYTLEIFAPLYEDQLKQPLKVLRNLQDLLGNIHDCDVWAELLPQFIEEEKWRTLDYIGYLRPYYRLLPGIKLFEDAHRDARIEQYRKFLESWQNWKDGSVWEDLRQTISIPEAVLETAPEENSVEDSLLVLVDEENITQPPEVSQEDPNEGSEDE